MPLEPTHEYGISIRIEQLSKSVSCGNAGALFVAFQRLQSAVLIRSECRATRYQSVFIQKMLRIAGHAKKSCRESSFLQENPVRPRSGMFALHECFSTSACRAASSSKMTSGSWLHASRKLRGYPTAGYGPVVQRLPLLARQQAVIRQKKYRVAGDSSRFRFRPV
jgi:hypothetical protein